MSATAIAVRTAFEYMSVIDVISYDVRKSNAYIDSLAIGPKGTQKVEGDRLNNIVRAGGLI